MLLLLYFRRVKCVTDMLNSTCFMYVYIEGRIETNQTRDECVLAFQCLLTVAASSYGWKPFSTQHTDFESLFSKCCLDLTAFFFVVVFFAVLQHQRCTLTRLCGSLQ